MKSCEHGSILDCLNCTFPDCISDNPPSITVDEYLQLSLDDARAQYEQLQGLMSRDLRSWCAEKGVYPRVKADVAILERARVGCYKGKKLEKALYKVRNRDKYLQQKKRNRQRKKINT